MKRILLLFFVFAIATIGAKAQALSGFDGALSLGSTGYTVDALTLTSSGDTYFVASVQGTTTFGGQTLTGLKKIFGKVSSSGTQTLLRLVDYSPKSVMINSSGELYLLTVGKNLANGAIAFDYGNGVLNDAIGYFMIKIDNSGVAQWKKSVDTGSDYEYGKNTSNQPEVFGMQFTPNGDLYILINSALGYARNPPLPNLNYNARAIKFDSDGNEVWYNEMFCSSTFSGGDKLNQFVSNDGRMTFNVISTNYNTGSFYFEGQYIGAQMSNYDGTNALRFITISLKPDGTKNFFVADTYGSTTLKAVNPNTGDLYINYVNFSKKFPATAPYNTFLNQYSPLIPTQYLFKGTITFDKDGQYKSVVTDDDVNYKTLVSTGNGFVALGGNIDKGDYTIQGADGVLAFYDASFNFLKAMKTPTVALFSVNGDKVAVAGGFKGTITLGNTTLVESPNQTISAYTKDLYIATANANNITPPAYNNWLGVDNNWNNVANWSLGFVPTQESLIKFNANTTVMPTTGTTPKALKVVIDAGVTAELPTDLQVGNKVLIEGKLQINHIGALSFSGYSPGKIEGTGTIAFNGSNTPSVNTTGYFTGVTLETNEDIYFLYPPTLKKLKFTGTNAIVKLNGNNLDITSSDEDAITGHSETNFIEGGLTRAVNPSGTYVFPGRPAGLKYEPATLTLNNLQGILKLKAEFNSYVSNPSYKFPDGSTCQRLLGNSGYGNSVKFTADAIPTAGTYSITLQKSGFSAGDLAPNVGNYVVLLNNKFQGEKLESTQSAGNPIVVTAGLSKLTKFGEFIIGINSAIVPTGTAIATATWTGNASGDWNTAGNWDSGVVPNGLTDVTIPVVTTVYPSAYGTTDFVNSLTINSGVVDMTLSHILGSNFGIINDGDVKIAKVSGTSSVYSGGTIGSGKLRFEADCGLTELAVSTANDVEINVGNTTALVVNGVFSGNINIKSGLISGRYGSNAIAQTNPDATIQIASPINGFSTEQFSQAVKTSGTYFFPLISYTDSQNSLRSYGGMTIKNNGIAEATTYRVRFDRRSGDRVSVLNGQDFYRGFINSGLWFITPDKFSATGTVDLALTTSGYSNGGKTDLSDYVLLRKESTFTNYADARYPWRIVSGATITENNGVINVDAKGIPAFTIGTTFCIGIKAAITTWTGTQNNTNWNDPLNWSNGLPGPEMRAVIGNATSYPKINLPSERDYNPNKPALMEIASGTVISLPADFGSPNGLLNNGTIKVTGLSSSVFGGFSFNYDKIRVTGTGKLVFDVNSPSTINYPFVLQNNIDIDKPSGITIAYTTNAEFDVAGNVNLINGIVTMAAGETFTMSNPNATFTSSANSYIMGAFKRKVNGTGTYNFPVGATNASLTLSGLVGTTDISTTFSTEAISGQPNLTIGTNMVDKMFGGGSWYITPNAQPTAGTYAVTLSAPIGSSTANDYFILKREYNQSYYPWKNIGTNAPSTISGGVVTASVSGLTSFSQFGIGEGVGTLPVKLIKFTASADAKSAKLYWETASELDNDKFDVERSTNGTDFIKVGEVKGNGTSQKLNTYNFRDFAPANGLNYYRLKQIDLNGKSEYSENKFVNFDFKETSFSVYPNPTTEVINFSEEVKSVSVYTLQGLLILEKNGLISSVNIPNNIATGIYLLKLKLANGNSLSKQIIITK